MVSGTSYGEISDTDKKPLVKKFKAAKTDKKPDKEEKNTSYFTKTKLKAMTWMI
ncbi:hypothetical protein [Candidatus Nitrosotenuis sp. DW1]|uniref:hypothetical protein n=1 Tax=Candidatus Nitrosotenuis sp. DW1 TaxID=2259672 RepID=UPI0015C954A5|nr:hypothetical protein [Candidatus Nitrosotenuis sp. DW1]